jgi:DNA-directed RNA polymerase subunit RPC12/RpoP
MPYSESPTMSLTRKPPPTRAIRCHKCSYRVALATTDRLPEEFTIRCPNCGRRDFYQSREVGSIEGELGVRSEQSTSRRAS